MAPASAELASASKTNAAAFTMVPYTANGWMPEMQDASSLRLLSNSKNERTQEP